MSKIKLYGFGELIQIAASKKIKIFIGYRGNIRKFKKPLDMKEVERELEKVVPDAIKNTVMRDRTNNEAKVVILYTNIVKSLDNSHNLVGYKRYAKCFTLNPTKSIRKFDRFDIDMHYLVPVTICKPTLMQMIWIRTKRFLGVEHIFKNISGARALLEYKYNTKWYKIIFSKR